MKGSILGHFELIELLGKGGMGQVWRARHLHQHHDVAIKFLTSEAARQENFHKSFEREVLSMARLHHENIALIIDYGVLDGDLEELESGSPFLVMEHVEGKSMKHLSEQLTWEQLARQIHDLLQALAHAHAKGIIHRDLKPHNVLVTPSGTSKLVDFGIALDYEYAMQAPHRPGDDPEAIDTKITGTPRYMSPEQIEGQWREQGPWTDLYSLGCLLWELVTGAPLFSGSLMIVLASQLAQRPPPLRPRFAVPEGFELWLNTLLRKDPRERFQRAADALAAFERIALHFEPDQRLRRTVDMDAPDIEADPDEATMMVDLDEGLTTTLERIRRMRALQDLERKRQDAPPAAPVLTDWRVAVDSPHRLDLLGSGLGLWGVRSFPMIGRERERDLLWQMLLLSLRKRSPQCIVLRGEPGCGKSRLAAWMCRRAHESGAAHILRATYSPHGSSQDGFAAMLLRFFDAYGLERAERAQQLVNRLGSSRGIDLAALVELTETERATDSTQDLDFNKNFHNPREKHYALIDLLVKLTEERPVILWIDDIQWALEATLFLKDLLERETLYDLPLMVMATERVDGSRSNARRHLKQLAEHTSLRSFDVKHLSDQEHSELVHQMLGLQPELARQVVQRTQGNPLFAVQLVGDWVDRGLLITGSGGFALRADVARPALPDDLHALWQARLHHVLRKFAGFHEEDLLRSLELAAALGQEISQEEWHLLCQRLGIELPHSMTEALLSSQLILQDPAAPSSWSFAHSMLHEYLCEHAKHQGRWQHYHAEIASWLDAHPVHKTIKERLARHLIMAHQWHEALSPLSSVIEKKLLFQDLETCQIVLDAYQHCVEQCQLPTSHPLHIQGIAYEAYLSRNLGERARAQQLIERAYQLVRKHPNKPVEALILKILSRLHDDRGDQARAAQLAGEVAEIQRKLGNQYEYAMALVGQAQAMGFLGKRNEADALVHQAIRTLRPLNEPTGLTIAYYVVSLIALLDGSREEAEGHLDKVLHMARQQGNRMQEANAENLLGNIDMERQRYNDAREHFERARELFRPCGESVKLVADLNVATIDVLCEHDIDALADSVTHISKRIKQLEISRLYGVAYMDMLHIHTHREQWSGWEETFALLVTWFKVDQTSTIEGQILKKIGVKLLDLGHLERARKVFQLALSVWQHLDREREIEETKSLIDRCRLFL